MSLRPILSLFTSYVDPCRGFTVVCLASASGLTSHHFLRNPLLNFFGGGGLHGCCSFEFCYDLDIWAKGQALRAFFVVNYFHCFIKRMRGILIKQDRKLRRHLTFDLIIVDLYICVYCVGLKLPIL